MKTTTSIDMNQTKYGTNSFNKVTIFAMIDFHSPIIIFITITILKKINNYINYKFQL